MNKRVIRAQTAIRTKPIPQGPIENLANAAERVLRIFSFNMELSPADNRAVDHLYRELKAYRRAYPKQE